MEFSKAQIATLVLGYLKSEKLMTVVDDFIKCCSFFKENHLRIGKYFPTRVNGMSLVDFLNEYAAVYSVVQGRIEETNYYEENHTRTSLVEQLLYLLDKEIVVTPSITTTSSEVEATPAHSLPGNSGILETDSSTPKTPKKRSSRSRSRHRDGDDLVDMTEVLTQSLLEHHELHEKIAETINIVRNTPEAAKPVTVEEEHISAHASKELDAVIKTVIQRTEEDPVYNKLIDEIIGTSAETSVPPKKCTPRTTEPLTLEDTPKTSTPQEHRLSQDPIEDHNNDAIRSIIEASQINVPPPLDPVQTKMDNTGEVYLFDGNLDTYLKSTGVTPSLNTNSLYLNPGGLIVMPPAEPPKQFYIVNNQPLLKMPTVLTEKEIMSIPTVIVKDDNPPPVAQPAKKTVRTVKTVKPKPKCNKPESVEPPVVTEKATPRPASHVRNLDFSTPGSNRTEPDSKSKIWDAELRQLIAGCEDKSPPRRRRSTNRKKKRKASLDEEKKEEPPVIQQTPVKDIPPTPRGDVESTPFTDVLEEHLKGVDLSTIPTPSIPITPGFALTPSELAPYNQRSTDYSTSSSYYQPSDTEQNKSIDQLIEECRRLENTSPMKRARTPNLKILSDVVIEQATVVEKPCNEHVKKFAVEKPCNEHLKKFNNNVIGKKNLSLLKRLPTTSSSSDSDSDNEPLVSINKTVIFKEKKNNVTAIKDILDTVEVKKTLDEDAAVKKKKELLVHLEEVRQRTVHKIKSNQTKKPAVKGRPKAKTTKKKPTKTKEKSPETKTDDEADKLVKGLAQRGIHLIPNKTPQKPKEEVKPVLPTQKVEEEAVVVFDRKTYEDCEVVVHDEKAKKKKIKDYDFAILKKSISAKVFLEDFDMEVTRIIKWTDCETTVPVDPISGVALDLRAKKRKGRFSQDENHSDKRKAYENIKLLKEIDVENFLDKVHGD